MKLSIGFLIACVLILGCKKEQIPPAKQNRESISKQALEREKAVIEKELPVSQPKIEMIEFEVLRSWTPGRKGTGMEILVSKKATKEQVMKLAHFLRKKYKLGGFIWISIFDSREAWKHRDDESYPSDKYFKHFLAQISVNPNTGHDKVSWVAEGRGY
ncbi:MAG: hypothetical protein P9X24_12915 [Candidatus Hatepunaea meridiana]|nr:hypothetical protein [Candidatus Hatepunaea meridiana]